MFEGTSIEFLSVMENYFHAQRLQAIYFLIPLAIGLVGVAYAAWRALPMSIGYALSIPLVLLGLLTAFYAIGYAINTKNIVQQIHTEYAQEPETVVADQLAKMEKLSQSVITMPRIAAGAVIVGLVLFFIIAAGWAKGLGAALLVFATLIFLVDGIFVSHRVETYIQALKQWKAPPSINGTIN